MQFLTKFGKLPNFQYVFVKLVIVADGKDDLVQAFKLFNIVGRNIPQLNPATGTRANGQMTGKRCLSQSYIWFLKRFTAHTH